MEQYLLKLLILLKVKLGKVFFVGEDQFKNTYYADPKKGKRFVLYNGLAEASKVPPPWQAWLNFTTDIIPQKEGFKYNWEKEHLPNLTGTANALKANSTPQQKDAPKYTAWTPQQ